MGRDGGRVKIKASLVFVEFEARAQQRRERNDGSFGAERRRARSLARWRSFDLDIEGRVLCSIRTGLPL